MRLALALVVLVACGGAHKRPTTSRAEHPQIATAADRILPILPEGAQVVIEVDLARLRANPVVGPLVVKALTGEGLPPLPGTVPDAPLAQADTVVLASYGVGTPQAATVVVLATKAEVPGAARLGEGLVALGPTDYVAQLEARAAIGGLGTDRPPLLASEELLALRDHAMPAKAPGASLRITARLPFDARVSLARQTGLASPPARVSVWADVADDFAIIIDADSSDPGDKRSAKAGKQLEASVRGLLAGIADEPSFKLLGLSPSLTNAKLTAQGPWLRTIIAIGPDRLKRVVERANAYLDALGGKS